MTSALSQVWPLPDDFRQEALEKFDNCPYYIGSSLQYDAATKTTTFIKLGWIREGPDVEK